MFGIFLLSPEIFLCLQVLFITFLAIILNGKTFKLQSQLNVLPFIHLLCCLILFYTIFILWNTLYYEAIILNYQLVCDHLSVFFKFIVLFMSFCCLLFTINYCEYENIKTFEFLILLLLAIIGILTIISSYDLLTMYLAIELQSLCFYIITNLKFYSNFSIEAGLKYFILGALSSSIILFGSSLLYGFTGATNFFDLSTLYHSNNIESFNLYNYDVALIGIIFIYCGVLFKIGIVPFHMWISDIYEGAPTNITMFFAIVPQISIISVLLRLNIVFFQGYLNYFFFLFIILSALSIIIGTLGAIFQVKLKRLLAYSSISNMGYMLSIMCSINTDSMFSIIFYVVIYNILALGLWLIVLNLRNRSNYFKFKNIGDLFILYNSNKYISYIFFIFLFSAMGIPPMLGFFSKLYIYFNIIYIEMYIYAFFLVIWSSIGAVYFLRLVKVMYATRSQKDIFLMDMSEGTAYFLMILLYLNVFYCLYPLHFSLMIYNILAVLL